MDSSLSTPTPPSPDSKSDPKSDPKSDSETHKDESWEDEQVPIEYFSFFFEDDKWAGDYLSQIADFIQKTAHSLKSPMDSFADIGCGGGHLCFHISKHFSSTTGFDLSLSFLKIANTLKSTSKFKFSYKNKDYTLQIPPNSKDYENVTFSPLNVDKLPASMPKYSAIHSGFTLCFAKTDAKPLIESLVQKIVPGGLLALSDFEARGLPYFQAAEELSNLKLIDSFNSFIMGNKQFGFTCKVYRVC